MAQASVFTAIDPNGVEHKRTSKNRVYTHTVVFQHSKAAAIERTTGSGNRDHHASNARYYLACVANGKHLNLMKFAHYAEDVERQARDVAESVERLAGATTVEEYVEAKIAAKLADIETVDWTAWNNAGWCGRHDLALKLQAQCGGVILTATKK